MATDPRKRQRKLERRSAKRKEKKHHLIKETQLGLGERLTAATKFPILHASITEDFWDQGIGWVLLSRELPMGQVGVAVFLVDRYCLGVKNVLAAIVSHSEYENEFVRKMRKEFAPREVSPATVRKCVEEAVAYAQNLGFPPHADYHKAKLLFGDIDASQSTEQFEFGKNGKPLFINGPNDSPSRCRHVINTLVRTRGPGNFDTLMMAGPDGDTRGLPQIVDDDSDAEEDIGDEAPADDQGRRLR
jgi:hypothetical protein